MRFKIKKGQKLFRPLIRIPKTTKNLTGFELSFKIERGAWASLEEWKGDKDWYDWMKLGGFTSFFSKNNSDSCLIGFRYGQEPETYEVTGYTNYPNTKFLFGVKPNEIAAVEAGKWYSVRVKIKGGKAMYTLPNGAKVEFPFKVRGLMRSVAPYPGGSNNSEGEFGGIAFKNIKLNIIIKK